ncbi:MAG: efflux RND transporter periplasmic adaptor subunit [Clostridiales bacterium]|nr:efflux RND transporter periplasmic adaptor subunit [Clostridiales bacterium]
MKRRILAFTLCAVCALSLSACSQDTAEVMDPTVTVESEIVSTGSLSSDSSYIGTISSDGYATVVSMVSGNVESIPVSVGDTVSAGQLLCSIDDDSAQITYKSAQAGYSSASSSYDSAVSGYGGDDLTVIQEQVKTAEQNYENTLALQGIGAASQTEVDSAYQTMISAQASLESAKASLESAKASVETAAASVDSAAYQLSLYRLTSPISGIVEEINVSENQFASSGTLAFIISNAEDKTVTFYVSDEVCQVLTQGQDVSVTYRGETYSGTISEIGTMVDTTTGLFKIKAVIEDADELPDGLSVEISTKSHEANNVCIIPCDALYFNGGDSYVYVIEDGVAVKTPVTLSLYTAEYAAITDGLSAGDEVITTWSATLSDGTPVRLGSDVDEAESEAEEAAE